MGGHQHGPQFSLEPPYCRQKLDTGFYSLTLTQQKTSCFNAVMLKKVEAKRETCFWRFLYILYFYLLFLFSVMYLCQCYDEEPLLKSCLALGFMCGCLEFDTSHAWQVKVFFTEDSMTRHSRKSIFLFLIFWQEPTTVQWKKHYSVKKRFPMCPAVPCEDRRT